MRTKAGMPVFFWANPMYNLRILDRKYFFGDMKRYIVSYTYSPNEYGFESSHHLIYFDHENDANTFLVRIKLALSVTSFDHADLTHIKSVVRFLVESDSNIPDCFHIV
jgi:hypothetical protein